MSGHTFPTPPTADFCEMTRTMRALGTRRGEPAESDRDFATGDAASTPSEG